LRREFHPNASFARRHPEPASQRKGALFAVDVARAVDAPLPAVHQHSSARSDCSVV
jgi:hypothetical protein